MDEDVLIDTFASWYSGAYDEMAEEAREFLRELKAEVWETAYRQGVEDERLGEVLQVDVGVGVPAQAARQDPYRGGQ
ncbi:hypothetical protein ABZX73_06360 [Brevibacterium casei]